ncbi:MAG: tetraacyldisaccharide 4'-kinase [Alphaproteobacteria bacterium]
MRAPEFWAHGRGPAPVLLAPLSYAWEAAGLVRRGLARPWRAPVPVVCIGNLVAGGAGKTPVALAVGEWLRGQGLEVHFLARGYGGREAGPLRVEPDRHTVREVGDEALLLAARAPTWIARDRPAGARAAAAAGAGVIVMDDGYQNPSLVKTLSLVVVDGTYGFGNGRLLPAGPLREPVARGLARAAAAVLVGDDEAGVKAGLEAELPVLRARLVAGPEAAGLAGREVVAFAGIACPRKFFDTIDEIGCRVVARHSFADHHLYTPGELVTLLEEAAALGAVPATTAKDAVRLPPEARAMVEVVAVSLLFEDPDALARVLRPVLGHA